MVGMNMGLPEPPDPESNLTANTDIIMPADTDSDDDENHYEGYERLPTTNPTEAEEEMQEDSEEEEQSGGLPSIVPIEDALVREVWAAPPVKDIEMDSDKVNQVKEAMLNFTLPPGNIPEWANRIPEDEWKEHIFKRLEKN